MKTEACPSVSFIIPVYNRVGVIGACIKSIMSNNYQKDIEVILVDDGSTDGTSELCDWFATQYHNIRVHHLERNMGVGYARQIGLKAACGTFIFFLDSDDQIDASQLPCLIQQMEDIPSIDLLIMNYVDVRVKDGQEIEKPQHLVEHTGWLPDSVPAILKILLPFTLWRVLFRKTFLETNKINFKSVRHGEDSLFNAEAIQKSERIYISTICFCKRYIGNTQNRLTAYDQPVNFVEGKISQLLLEYERLTKVGGKKSIVAEFLEIFRSLLWTYFFLYLPEKFLYKGICDDSNCNKIKKGWVFHSCQKFGVEVTMHLVGKALLSKLKVCRADRKIYMVPAAPFFGLSWRQVTSDVPAFASCVEIADNFSDGELLPFGTQDALTSPKTIYSIQEAVVHDTNSIFIICSTSVPLSQISQQLEAEGLQHGKHFFYGILDFLAERPDG